jgi:outer membrane protein OmpU
MTNLKKLGLTALAGSLVATTAYAGALDVSGIAKVSYTSGDTGLKSSGNPFSMTRDITFSGSGEMDNGMTISYFQMLTAGSISSSGLTLDMGDAGTATFMNGASGGHGIAAYEDKVPTAAEQVWDDLDGEENGVVSMNDANTIGYGTSFAGVNVSANYNKQTSGGSAYSVGLDFAPVDGAMLFLATSDKYAGPQATTDEVHFRWNLYCRSCISWTSENKYRLSTADSDTDRTHLGASFAVNEDLSISWGMSTVEFEDGSLSDQEDSGFSASYTMGSMSLTAAMNSSDNVSGASGTDDEHKEIGLAFAF